LIVEVGSYTYSEQVGYKGWVAFEKQIAFEGLDGGVVVLERR
jgi:hypothetical protein